MSKDKCESFAELAQSTTLHGLHFLTAAKSVFRKLFWTGCLFGAVGFCVLLMKESFEYYYLRPFSTVVTENRENKIVFPEVTICNLNRLHTGKYSKLLKKLFPNITDGEIEDDISRLSRFSTSKFLSQANFTKNNLTTISYGIDDILLPKDLLSCTFAGKTCGVEHFKTLDFAKYIQCFTFKPPDPEVDAVGYINGLRLRMNVGADFYLPDFYEPFLGMKVFVHPSGEYPQVDAYGFLIEPGIHTSCSLRRVQVINLEKPYQTNCGEKELKFANKQSYLYSRTLCIQDCYYRVIVDRCHCKTIEMTGKKNLVQWNAWNAWNEVLDCQYLGIIYTAFMKNGDLSRPLIWDLGPKHGRGNLPLCLDEKQFNCIFSAYENTTKVPWFSKCVSSCQESCKFSWYKTKLSTAKLHAKNMANAFAAFCRMKKHKPSLCHDIRNKSHTEKIQFVRDNIVSLEVYLITDYYDEMRQKPSFEWFELISDVGGNLGLFLGASILTLVEFVEYVVRLLWCKMRMTVKPKSIEIKSHDSNTQSASGMHDMS